jgi:hypothetical protein
MYESTAKPMSIELKGKKKKRKQKVPPEMQPSQGRPTIPTVPKRQTQTWTMLGVGIGLMSLVALIELFPRLSATASSPTDLDDPLSSSRFTVSNDGYLKVTDVMSACFMWKVEMEFGGRPNIHMGRNLARIVQPPESNLSPMEGLTVPCTGNKLMASLSPYVQPVITYANLAIVVYYRAWPFTFYRDHRLFRFVANFGKHGEITWEKQPAAELEQDYNRFIKQHGGTFPPRPPVLRGK